MFSPSPGLWPGLIEDRQRRLRGAFHAAPTRRGSRARVLIGHLLIAAGSALSGERVELAARSPVAPRSA